MTGSRPIDDGRALATCYVSASDETVPAVDPQLVIPHHDGRRRHGRHSWDALGTHAVPVGVFTARHLLAPTSEADPAHGIKVSAAQVGLLRCATTSGTAAGLDVMEVYAAAGRACQYARETVARLAMSADRMQTAARTIAPQGGGAGSPSPSQAEAVAEAVNHRLHGIEHAQRKLVDALDALDEAKVTVGDADRALRQFHPYGGTSVATLPTRKRALIRLDQATAAVGSCHHVADNATYSLVKQIIAGQRVIQAVEYLIAYCLDHALPAATAPPPYLRLVRAALPAGQQLDWWRELCSLFAECDPHERQIQATSQGLNALRTIWTAWLVTRNANSASRTQETRLTSAPRPTERDPRT